MTLSPAPKDVTDQRAWMRWAEELRKFITSAGQFAWTQISMTGSDLADLETKAHTDLTSVGTNTHTQIDAHIAASNPHSGSGGVAAAVADLNQTITNPPTQTEVQDISDKIDELLAAMRTAGSLET